MRRGVWTAAAASTVGEPRWGRRRRCDVRTPSSMSMFSSNPFSSNSLCDSLTVSWHQAREFFLSGVSSCCGGPPKIYLKKYISTHTYYIHLYYYRCCYFNRAKFLSFKKNLPNQKGRLLFYSLDYYMVSKTFFIPITYLLQ